jgi:hypothetical protein
MPVANHDCCVAFRSSQVPYVWFQEPAGAMQLRQWATTACIDLENIKGSCASYQCNYYLLTLQIWGSIDFFPGIPELNLQFLLYFIHCHFQNSHTSCCSSNNRSDTTGNFTAHYTGSTHWIAYSVHSLCYSIIVLSMCFQSLQSWIGLS